jgi:hypothetical protein
MTRDAFGAPHLDLKADAPRVFALLAAAYARSVSPDVLRHINDASEQWRRGDKALANIRLAFARLPRLEDRAGAFRLFHAEVLLEQGMSARTLLHALGFDKAAADLAKYDPNQPRVPPGSGRNSGQWTSGGGGSQGSEPTSSRAGLPTVAAIIGAAIEHGTLAEGLFASSTSVEFLTGLVALENIVGTAAVLGAIFVPRQNRPYAEGPIPGDPDLHYSIDNDKGVLRFFHRASIGEEVVAVARKGRAGIFFEMETGTPVARAVGGSLVFDAVSLAQETDDTHTRTEARVDTNVETNSGAPQLCPDPGPDIPHDASARAIAYQAQISALNNPNRPLPPGLAVSLINPKTGRRVVYDDCRESDDVMIEAKGPGYAKLLRYSYFAEEILPERWRNQAARQIDASGRRDLEWFFAEPEAQYFARKLFDETEGIGRIRTRFVAPKA